MLVLWQGIISPYKGVDVLLQAWRQVEASVPNARLVVAGTGAPDLLGQLKEQARQLGLNRVHLDFRFISSAELVAAYRAADVVVYPYLAITTSGALATGLALGKTIVASDLPVFRELLNDHGNALLVSPQDSEALARALIELAFDPALRERLAARIRDMNFGDQSWVSIAEKTLDVYRKVAHHRLQIYSGTASLLPASAENRAAARTARDA